MYKKVFLALAWMCLGTNLHAVKPISFEALKATKDLQKINIPDKIDLERVPTLNGTGYIFYLHSPLTQDFIKEQANTNNTVVEIGAGFSNVAIETVQKGCRKYIVNDILPEHLYILAKRILTEFPNDQEKFKVLEFLPAQVPEELPVFKEPFDAILADKVLHFMDPDDIDLFMSWAAKSLKKGGKLYILTMSPYIPSFREKLLPYYLEKKKKGFYYAGFVENTNRYLKSDHYHTQYTIPQAMTFMDLEDLQGLLVHHGFEVVKKYALLLPSEKSPSWRYTSPYESDLVGVIGVKS